jgi:hypothetical protein
LYKLLPFIQRAFYTSRPGKQPGLWYLSRLWQPMFCWSNQVVAKYNSNLYIFCFLVAF